MHYEKLAEAAMILLRRLPDFGLAVENVDLQADRGCFRDVFREVVQPCGGAYWFFGLDGTVFDIGKADSNIWARISAQAGKADWYKEAAARVEGATGEGWGFPNSSHLREGTADDATADCVRAGTFHVGWVAFEPGYYATFVEVYLQTFCRKVDGKLPAFCKKIG